MNVPNIGQGPGSVTTLPRDIASGETAAPDTGAAERGLAPSRAAAPAISFTRLAWFDVNGDGSIDPRSASAGGDATLLVPTHAVDLPTYSRPAHPMGGGRPAKGREPAAAPAPITDAGTSAQANRAVESYQRYGQTAPAAPTAPPAAPAPAASDGSTGATTAR